MSLVFILFVASSCNKQEAEQITPGLTAEQQALVKSDPALTGIQANGGGFSTARAAAPGQCDGYLVHQKSHWPIEWLNEGPLKSSNSITGGRKLVGVLETAPAVAKGEDVTSGGKFFEAFDCPKIATFQSLVWTVDPKRSSETSAVFYAGYFLDKTTSVSYTLLVTKDNVRLECLQQTVVNEVANPTSTFMIRFAYSGTATPPSSGTTTPPTTGTGTGTTAGKLVVYYEGGKIRVNEDIIDASDRPKAADVNVAFENGQVVLKEAAKVTGLNYSFPNGSFGNGLSAWDWYGYYLYHSGASAQLTGGTWTKSENSQATTWKKVQGGFVFYMHVTKASTIYKPLDSATVEQPGKQFFILEVVKDGVTEGTKGSPVSVGVWPLQ